MIFKKTEGSVQHVTLRHKSYFYRYIFLKFNRTFIEGVFGMAKKICLFFLSLNF